MFSWRNKVFIWIPLALVVVSSDSLCGQQRSWSNCMDTQAELGFRCLMHWRHYFTWQDSDGVFLCCSYCHSPCFARCHLHVLCSSVLHVWDSFLFKGTIFLKSSYFIIQERFYKLIYGNNTIIKCGTWQLVKFQLVCGSWNEMIFLLCLWINVGNINSEIR